MNPTGQEIKAHDGAVWQVSWAHPKFGTLLASASFDSKGNFRFLFLWRYVLVIIHSENADGSWSIVYVYAEHRTSVNTVQFAPAEFGLVLACGSTDGDVSILTGDPKVHSLFEAFIKQT